IVQRWRDTGTRFARLSRLVEVPLFVDSRASRLVQCADVIAHAVYRAYAAGDDALLARLLPAFDNDGGRIHGLVHLRPRYRAQDCRCAACSSRVLLPIAAPDG